LFVFSSAIPDEERSEDSKGAWGYLFAGPYQHDHGARLGKDPEKRCVFKVAMIESFQ
jgi:hypothetical protein